MGNETLQPPTESPAAHARGTIAHAKAIRRAAGLAVSASTAPPLYSRCEPMPVTRIPEALTDNSRKDKTLKDLKTGDSAIPSDDFTGAAEPWGLFSTWMEEAARTEPNDPNAMALATVDADGLPDVRMVLLKSAGEDGFVFYTNTESTKGRELADNPGAAVVLHWKSLRRQVRARGPVTRVSDAEADAYFQSRPRDSRIGAWASRQSRPLESRRAFEEALEATAARFADSDVPRPPHWTGFRIAAVSIEFWQDRPFRLHDRIVFTRAPDGWARTRLFP